MARPNKNNAEYFTHDADMRNDIKVKALRRKYGHTGYAVWNYILETLTDSEDFEIDYSDVGKELLAADFDISVDELKDIVGYACKVGLLQTDDEGTTLYSEAHRRRFSQLLERRGKLSEAGKKGMAKRWSLDNNVITPLSEVITSDNKVKYSKVKESKVKESKVNNRAKALVACDEVASLWNATCVSLPKAISLNAERRKKIETRAQEIAASGRDPMETLAEVFRIIERSDFLAGRVGKKWKATFDWIFQNGNNWTKVLEGNYSDEASSRPVSAYDTRLGAGERIEDGRRTYGTGKASIPMSAPPRPSEQYSWNAETQDWIIL